MSFGIKIKRRIQACYELGLPNADWYNEALLSIEEYLDFENALDDTAVERMAAYLSIASPRVQVSRSINIAKHFFFSGKKLAGTLEGVYKKLKEYRKSPSDYKWPLKTGKFFDAIMGDREAVVVDIHISRAFGFDDGYPMQTTKAAQKINAEIVKHVKSVGDTCPRNTQAAIWCGWLRFNGASVGKLEL